MDMIPVPTEQGRTLKPYQKVIRARKGLIAVGDGFSVALHESDRLLYTGTDRCGQSAARELSGVVSVLAVGDSLTAVGTDGTVHSYGRSVDETDFADGLACVRRLELGPHHMAALIGNGRVLVRGLDPRSAAEVDEWSDVTDIACGASFVAGLSGDGRVFLVGGHPLMRRRIDAWPRIAGIFADSSHDVLYAITAGGRLYSTAKLPRRIREWKELIHLSACGDRLCAVTVSGRLLASFDVSPAMTADRSFVSCAVGDKHVLALTRDGMVASDGDNRFGQCNTAAFGALFARYDEFIIRRRDRESEPEAAERIYQERLSETQRFAKHLACSERLTACVSAYGRALASPAFAESKFWKDIHSISCGNAHILGLGKNGRVLADGNPLGASNANCCDVSAWTNVRAVEAGSYHSLGVTYDGRVFFCGSNEHGQGDVTDWTSIRLVRTTDAYTVGLTYAGRLLVAGLAPFDHLLLDRIDVRVTDVQVTDTHVLALLADRRAFATLPPDPTTGRTDIDPTVASWTNIRAIAADRDLSVGLTFGGTVRAAGCSRAMADELATWKRVVSIGCGRGYVAGLTADGRLCIAGAPVFTKVCHSERTHAHTPATAPIHTTFEEASYWQDLIAFACGPSHLIALNRDGQVLACGSDSDGQCTVTTHFTLFRDARALAGYGRYRKSDDENNTDD